MSAAVAALLCLGCAGADAASLVTGYGPVLKGRTSFYGGAPDHANPNTASYGTLNGACGCVRQCTHYITTRPQFILHIIVIDLSVLYIFVRCGPAADPAVLCSQIASCM